MRTRIELGTSGSIDLLEDVPISLNYAIADIRDPDKRNSSFSKTITIPGSKSNNIIFNHIFEININSTFNPNLKTPAVIYDDDIEILRGYLRLIKINRLIDGKIEYECSIIGNVGNVFTDMADSYLSDLDFSELNHKYNKTNQVASWTAPVGAGYVYPFIDYGRTNGNTMDVKDFFPAIYVKKYVDKILSYYGYSYVSSFMDTDLFKRLIIPYNSITLGLTEDQITSRLFSADINSSGSVTLPTTPGAYSNIVTTIIPYNRSISDPTDQFKKIPHRFVCKNPGNYSIIASFSFQGNISSTIMSGWAHVMRQRNGTTISMANVHIVSANSGTVSISVGAEVLVGDEIFISLQCNASGGGSIVNIYSGLFFNKVNNVGLFDGDDLVMSNAVPLKVKQKDFLMSIVKMFNLYIEVDKVNPKKLYIEPRDDFYSNGVNRDWTSKLDISQELQINPMGELNNNQFTYTYTDDKDYYNNLYKTSYLEVYGTKVVDVNNEFVKGKKETKVIFSPTPLACDYSNDRIISKIYSTDSSGNITPKESNIRILYYGGVLDTNYQWNYTSLVQGDSYYSTYPYAGHLDVPTNPTIDLNWAVPKEVYYSTTKYTNNGLYNAYHSKFLSEIIDQDSKIVTGYFNLNSLDINLLDFRDTYYVLGIPLRLNKVYDYNPINPGLTKCEFIKIKYTNAFEPVTLTSNGGVNHQFPQQDQQV